MCYYLEIAVSRMKFFDTPNSLILSNFIAKSGKRFPSKVHNSHSENRETDTASV